MLGSVSALDEVCSKPRSEVRIFCKTEQPFPHISLFPSGKITSFKLIIASFARNWCVVSAPRLHGPVLFHALWQTTPILRASFSFSAAMLNKSQAAHEALSQSSGSDLSAEMPQTAYFALPSSPSDRLTREKSRDSREGSSVSFNSNRSLISTRLQIYSRSWR